VSSLWGVRLRCTNCDAAFEGDASARCPKCLRVTSVIEAIDGAHDPRDGAPAPWPAGTACPLCVTGSVSDATFHFELPIPQGASPPGGIARWMTVRCRCCEDCRGRVVGLRRLRSGALPLVALGMLLWPLALVSDLPLRAFGLGKLEGVMLSTLVCAVLVGVPLVLVDRASRSMRRNLEKSWLFRRVQERVGAIGVAGAVAPQEHWRLLADAPASAVVIEAVELLRSDSVGQP